MAIFLLIVTFTCPFCLIQAGVREQKRVRELETIQCYTLSRGIASIEEVRLMNGRTMQIEKSFGTIEYTFCLQKG